MAMHELLTTVGGWWMNHAQDSLLRYLTHSAVTLAMVGAVAWLGDRLLRSIGPQAQHRLWVTALMMSVALPLLPAGWLARLGPAHTSAGFGTVTVTYNTVAAAAERWTVSPLICAMLAAAYLLTLLSMWYGCCGAGGGPERWRNGQLCCHLRLRLADP
jgi:hypothetical protein